MVHSFSYKMTFRGAFYNGPCFQNLLIPALNSLLKKELVGDTLDNDFKIMGRLANAFCKGPVWDIDGS